MTFDSESFAQTYAIKYTAILAVILIVPLIFYLKMFRDIDNAKVKSALNTQVKRVILAMDKYDNKDEVYTFPRYKEFDTALYTENHTIIFSTFNESPALTVEPSIFSIGFHTEGNNYYMIYPLPKDYYFESKYLLVSTFHEANNMYSFALFIILIILIILFILSLRLFQNFSRPFEEINHRLDNFIKDSMHEINTPLSIININADLFANKYGDNKYLQRMKSASKTLATIYDDMDYLIKQGRVEHTIKNINVSEFIENRIDYFKGIATLKSIEMNIDITPNLMYKFSKTKLQRIVDNTLSNAIKYSYDDNTVEVKVEMKNEKIIFSVEDHGVGIENLEHIFSRYYRENQTKGGFGIGLNIVKDIIDEEGIDLEVKSEVGVGTIFIYTFPKKTFK